MAIAHKGKEVPILLIINAEDDWIVVHLILPLKQFIRTQILHVELATFERYLLTHPLLDSHLLDVIFFVRGVHHDRYVVPILLLSDASIDAEVPIAEGINLEGNLKDTLRSYSL